MYEGMKAGNVYINVGYANYLRKRYRLKKGENNGSSKNERTESEERRYATTGDDVV